MDPHKVDQRHQGYELTDDEVRISLDDFRRDYTDPSGGPEYVCRETSILCG